MVSHVCLFEDSFSARLLPLVYFRPVYNLKSGILSLKEKVMRAFPRAAVSLHCRSYLAEYMRVRYPGVLVNELDRADHLLVNGRLLIDSGIAGILRSDSRSDCVYRRGDEIVAVRVRASNLHRATSLLNAPIAPDAFGEFASVEVDARLIRYPWELVQLNGKELEADARLLAAGRKRARRKRLPGVQIIGTEVAVEPGAEVLPGVVLDARNGPVHIARGARVLPNAVIMGPASIGEGSWVKAGALIYGNTSIGPACKVGGEVVESIFQGYSNKQHGGFLGHSYLGAWVNIGAGTTTSNLKTNYGPVRVTLGTEQIDTGLQFVGLIMGDHSKSAINSSFNTGTVVGVSSNIFGTGFPPKYVPSFSWGGAEETFTTFNVDKAIEVARRVMVRRAVQLTAQEEHLFRTIFELTSAERRRQGMPQ